MRLEDLRLLNFGDVVDLIIESGNDHATYEQKATEADIRKVFG